MNSVHAEAFDLNLLLAFDALWTERHVTRAAKRVGLTQSAMSHALKRLRAQLDDALFRPTPRGLHPTPRALAVAAPLADALASLRRALAAPAPFSPARLGRTFTIGTHDYGNVVILPGLMQRLARAAPNVRLGFRLLLGDGERQLLDDELDLVLGVVTPSSPGIHCRPLFRDGFTSLLRAGHPALRRPLTLDRFCALQHVLVSPTGVGEAAVDVALRAVGRRRDIVLRVSHFLAAPLVVSTSDYIVTLPDRLARAVAKQHRLVMRPPPVKLPVFDFNLLWHARSDEDEGHAWLRRVITELMSPDEKRRRSTTNGDDS